jgi:hypothetical protein
LWTRKGGWEADCFGEFPIIELVENFGEKFGREVREF